MRCSWKWLKTRRCRWASKFRESTSGLNRSRFTCERSSTVILGGSGSRTFATSTSARRRTDFYDTETTISSAPPWTGAPGRAESATSLCAKSSRPLTTDSIQRCADGRQSSEAVSTFQRWALKLEIGFEYRFETRSLFRDASSACYLSILTHSHSIIRLKSRRRRDFFLDPERGPKSENSILIIFIHHSVEE